MMEYKYLNNRLQDLENVDIGGIDYGDYPKFCDAFVESASLDGRELTDEELDYISEECMEWVNCKVFEQIL